MKLPILFCLLLFLVQACTGKTKLSFPKDEDVKTKVIVSDLHLQMASDIYVTDTLLIVQDVRAQEKYLKYYHLEKNELIAEFGQTGKGPEQLITPYITYVDPLSSTVYVHDPNMQKIHQFDIAQYSEKPDTVFDIAITQSDNRDRIFDVTQPNGSIIYGRGLLHGGFLAAVNTKKGELINYFGKYPLKINNSNNLNLGEACNSTVLLTPDKKRLIVATSRFGYLASYRVENNDEKPELEWEVNISKPLYRVEGQRIIFSPHNETGTMSMALTNDKIFLLRSEEDFRYYTSMDPRHSPRIIMVFSMEGKPLAKYHLDRPSIRIAVDRDENIYCITEDPEYNLVKLEL